MFRFQLLCITLCASALPALAQPISDSMVECSALSHVTAGYTDDPVVRDRLLEQSDGWFDAAFEQARQEGRADIVDALNDLANDAENRWRSRGSVVVLTGEFKDWTDYCQSLAGAMALDFYISGS